jgi:hypothetical protein
LTFVSIITNFRFPELNPVALRVPLSTRIVGGHSKFRLNSSSLFLHKDRDHFALADRMLVQLGLSRACGISTLASVTASMDELPGLAAKVYSDVMKAEQEFEV